MILRFKTQGGKHFVNINTDKECYNYGETAGAYYIPLEEKDYMHILAEMNFNCYGYEEYLGLNVPEEYHPFLKSELNEMCIGCSLLYNLCDGTKEKIYSGCVWKDASPQDIEAFLNITHKNISAETGGLK